VGNVSVAKSSPRKKKKKELLHQQGREATLVLVTRRNTHFARNRRHTCFVQEEEAHLL